MLWLCSCYHWRVDWLQNPLAIWPLTEKVCQPLWWGYMGQACKGHHHLLRFHQQNSAIWPFNSTGGWKLCPQRVPRRETGRLIIWQVSATNTPQALVTSASAFRDPPAFPKVRSIFLTTCQTSHTSCPQTELDIFPSKSVSPSVVHNSVNCSSFIQVHKLETPGLP